MNIPAAHLRTNLECLAQALHAHLAPPHSALAQRYLRAGLDALPVSPEQPPAHVVSEQPLADLARDYLGALLAGNRPAAERMILEAVESGAAVRDVYLHVFQHTQREVGRRWQMNQLTVAHEHYCTASTQLIMARLTTHVFDGPRANRRLLAVGVEGELHELGIRMVADFFEMRGWDTVYLGANTPTRDLLRFLRTQAFDVLAIGATMTFHVRRVAELIEAVRSQPRAPRILVGGYPFLIAPELRSWVGADLCGRDAAEAVDCVAEVA